MQPIKARHGRPVPAQASLRSLFASATQQAKVLQAGGSDIAPTEEDATPSGLKEGAFEDVNCTQRLSSPCVDRHEEQERQRRQQEAAHLQVEERLQEYRRLLIETCLTIKCPGCRLAGADSTYCDATTCGNRACGAGRCDLCAGEYLSAFGQAKIDLSLHVTFVAH
jgi:hypothetical protein